MTQKAKVKLKKGDFSVVIFLLLICTAIYCISAFRTSNGAVAVITVDGKTVYETDISKITEERTFELENGIKITEAPGEIYFSSSPCAGKDCVKTGKLTKPGDAAVCLPQKTVIKITGEKSAGTPDAIT